MDHSASVFSSTRTPAQWTTRVSSTSSNSSSLWLARSRNSTQSLRRLVGGINPLNMMPLFATATTETAPEKFDILVIPGGLGVDSVVENEKFMSYIRQTAEKATDVLTVATGSRILGATGLLDGKKATTMKMEFGDIAAEYPDVNWVQQARWVVDGKWWTSSGSASCMDMGRAYISAKYGEEMAKRMSELGEYVAHTDPNDDPFAPGAKPVTSPAPSSSRPSKCKLKLV